MGCAGSKTGPDQVLGNNPMSPPPSAPESSASRSVKAEDESFERSGGGRMTRRESFKGVQLSIANELDYEACMANKEALDAILEFATAEFSEENVRFWIEVQDYKRKAAAAEESAAALEAIASRIIDTFLCRSAETLVNLPAAMLKQFGARSDAGSYEFSPGMFDGAAKEISTMIKRDTWSRFRLSDAAEELVWNVPLLAVKDTTKVYEHREGQRQLRTLLAQVQQAVDAERAAAWVLHGQKLTCVAATNLGNASVTIPVGLGLAGSAALSGEVVNVDDAYAHGFLKDFDQATGYTTKSVLCVPMKREETEAVALVLQALNKRAGDDAGEPASFSEDDAVKLKVSFEKPLVDLCDAIALASMSKELQEAGIDVIAKTAASPPVRRGSKATLRDDPGADPWAMGPAA